MALIYTAFASYRGGDKIDISRKSATDGIIWAPSWELLGPFLELRKGNGLLPKDWARYEKAYKEEMRQSYRAHRAAWRLLLQRPGITLTCYCKRPEQCHRTILGRDILPAFGCEFRGEWQECLL